MSATGRTTRLLLLLSLGVLVHISEVQADPTGTKDDKTVLTVASPTATVGLNASAGLGNASGAPTTVGSGNTTTPTQAAPPPTPKPSPEVTTPANTTTLSSPNPADKSISTQTQASTVPSNTTAPSTSISAAPPSVGNGATPPATTPIQPKTTLQAATSEKAATAHSGGGPAVSSDTGVLQTTSTPTTSGSPAPVTPPGGVWTTKRVADATTSQPEIPNHTTTSQDSNGGAGTGTGTGSGQTSPRSTESAGNAGTSSTPPTLTTAGPPAAETTIAGTTSPPQTTTTAAAAFTTTSTTTPTTATAAQPKTFLYSLNSGPEKDEEKDLAEVCRRLLVNLQDGNCTLKWQHRDAKVQFDYVEINGKVKTSLASQYYEEITKKPADNKTLIAILASCGALLIMIVILAVCASHHRKPYHENQQHLTEELHTVENGYHDNPTLEVMEVQPEMQEKKTAPNGEFNDSWIVPIDNLLKEDLAGEEDTHL